MGDRFEPGPWTLGRKYKVMCWIALIEIVIISIYFILPLYPSGWITNDAFEWKFVNYAPILTGGTVLLVAIWWHLSAKKWFTGPKHTIDPDVVKAFED
jgi:peptidoglycan/LPS O-acetylase OafA/YrhL